VLGFASFEKLLLAAAVVAIGAIIQGSIGFGLAVWSVPFLVLIDARLVPGPLAIAAMSLILGSAWRERRSIDLKGAGWVLAGRVPGTLLGAALLAAASTMMLSVLLGSLVLLAVGISLLHGRFARTRLLSLAVGFTSGIMGTLAALGGPPIAVLYQHEEGPRIRATLAAVFAAGALMSLTGIALVGRLGRDELLLGAVLVPPVLLGLLASNAVLRVLDPGRIRTFVLIFAAAGGALAIGQGLWLWL
jgi:uncharacterized membrane protein YfcA